MARIGLDDLRQMSGHAYGVAATTSGALAVREVRALRADADLAVPPHAAELRQVEHLLDPRVRRDELRLPARAPMDAAAALAAMRPLLARKLDAATLPSDAVCRVLRMQDALRTLDVAGRSPRTTNTLRI